MAKVISVRITGNKRTSDSFIGLDDGTSYRGTMDTFKKALDEAEQKGLDISGFIMPKEITKEEHEQRVLDQYLDQEYLTADLQFKVGDLVEAYWRGIWRVIAIHTQYHDNVEITPIIEIKQVSTGNGKQRIGKKNRTCSAKFVIKWLG